MKKNFTFGIPNDGGNFTEIFQISGKKNRNHEPMPIDFQQ